MTQRSKIQVRGRDIMVTVTDTTIEMNLFGFRERFVLAIEQAWEMATKAQDAPPPITQRSKNSIVASFVRHRGKASVWLRHDTGEELTERQLRMAGKRERRAVIPVYGMPNEAVKGMGHGG